MPATLLDLPDELFAQSILAYLPTTDVLCFGAICRRFHGMRNMFESEIRARDDALIMSQQYPRESPIMSIFDYRERVVSFERCRAFASEMTRQARHHETCSSSRGEHGCTCIDYDVQIPKLENGLRDGKHYLFFAQFSCGDKLLWQGFLKDFDSRSDYHSPLIPFFEVPHFELRELLTRVNAAMGEGWEDFHRRNREQTGVQFHLDASNVTNLTKDDVNSELHVTVVSLIHPQEQPGLLPELRLHYSSRGHSLSSGSRDSPSFDILQDRCLHKFPANTAVFATPHLMWKSSDSLHSLSVLFRLVRAVQVVAVSVEPRDD